MINLRERVELLEDYVKNSNDIELKKELKNIKFWLKWGPEQYTTPTINSYIHYRSEITPTTGMSPIRLIFNQQALVHIKSPVVLHLGENNQSSISDMNSSLDVKITNRKMKKDIKDKIIIDGMRIYNPSIIYNFITDTSSLYSCELYGESQGQSQKLTSGFFNFGFGHGS